ncbi:hypothetical protein PR202_gb28051 [Eleusine coracana subsp. coracana]|uniref:Fe2OG dioxygenase domain-containing protein n=1 Tax=Eleusine coracana subsp. coracana TaxID=191504 RepID=A0AAV5FWW1_ELECO|nr:hypothetical protein QOZ80_6AG0546580 [Eleusine coracana subsp. coracana]GJN38965.1 hypothetical protein PR202_gb28051 [Eleusine coracana subsp. coracana]
MAAGNDDDYDAASAVAEFHESRGGVHGLLESGVTTVPLIFLTPPTASPWSPSPAAFAFPVVDLSLPRAHTVELVRAAASSLGVFYVTNYHGVQQTTATTIIDSAISAVRAFHEQPRAARSAFYSASLSARPVAYATIPNPALRPGQPAAHPLLPWRDSLIVQFNDGGGSSSSAQPAGDDLPQVCRDDLLEYHRFLTGFGKEIMALLSEALGLPAERIDQALQVQGSPMVCHYYPPCPEPARVVGAREHTDASLFTVLAEDRVGGLQVWLDDDKGGGDGGWVDVPPVTGALLINIGDVLKVISNDEYKSVEHRVVINSSQEARVSIALFFRPANCGESDFFGPLPELLTEGRPARYKNLTFPQLMNYRRELGHARSSLDGFKI